MFLAACPAAQQKHPQRMAGLLQLRRSALRMLIFYAAPPLLIGKSGHRLRFDVICRNTPAFLAPRSGELPGEARLRGFILPACGRRSAPDRPGCCCPGQICRSGGASSAPAPRTTGPPWRYPGLPRLQRPELPPVEPPPEGGVTGGTIPALGSEVWLTFRVNVL